MVNKYVIVCGFNGDFWLCEGLNKVLFIVGGSGLVLIFGMLEEMDKKGDCRLVILMFGVWEERDLYVLE